MSTSTKYLNNKRSKIYKSDRGAYFIIKKNKRIYGIKASYEVVNGNPVKITFATAKSVPCAIRPIIRQAGSSDAAAAQMFMKKMTTSNENIKKLKRLNAD